MCIWYHEGTHRKNTLLHHQKYIWKTLHYYICICYISKLFIEGKCTDKKLSFNNYWIFKKNYNSARPYFAFVYRPSNQFYLLLTDIICANTPTQLKHICNFLILYMRILTCLFAGARTWYVCELSSFNPLVNNQFVLIFLMKVHTDVNCEVYIGHATF